MKVAGHSHYYIVQKSYGKAHSFRNNYANFYLVRISFFQSVENNENISKKLSKNSDIVKIDANN